MNLFNALRKKYKSVDITFLNIWKEDIAYKNEIIENGGHILNYQMPTGIKNMVFGHNLAKKLFSVYKFDAIHINANYLLPSFFAIAAKNSGVTKVIFHAHNTSYGNRSFLKKSILKSIAILQRKKLNNKNIQLLAASTEAGNWMFRKLDFTVITNGIEVEKFNFDRDIRNEVRRNLNIPEDSKVIISVARIEYQKNHEKIISIFNELYYKKNII
ncbi:glycosyl transferase GT4 family protein [Weissella koreensis KACC 15510]|nr:glycosyl transferase GT4 family protein [Weissella koreensis KACC 15510]